MQKKENRYLKPPTAREAKRAGQVIRRFCLTRTGDYACKWCPLRDMCKTEPYTWEVQGNSIYFPEITICSTLGLKAAI